MVIINCMMAKAKDPSLVCLLQVNNNNPLVVCLLTVDQVE